LRSVRFFMGSGGQSTEQIQCIQEHLKRLTMA
jgi:hypothetical protein